MKKLIGKLETFYNSSKAKFKAFLFKHEKINRIFTLTCILVKNPKRLRKQRKFSDNLLIALVKLAVVVGMFFVFKYGIKLFLQITKLEYVDVSKRVPGTYVNFVLFVYVVLSIISISISFISTMYRAKDNTLLLSYPVETRDIFISKLLVKLIQEYKKSLLILLPFLVGVYINRKAMYWLTPSFIGWSIFLFIAIPLIIVLVSGVLSILFTYISILFKKINPIKVVFLIGLAVGIIVGLIYLVNQIPLHLSIYDLWHQIVGDVNNALVTFSNYTPFSKTCTNLLFKGGFVNFIIIFAVIAVFAALVIFVAYRFFFSLVYKPINDKPIRLSRKTKTKQRKNIFLIFLNKEFKTYLRSDDGLITSIIYILALPVLLYCLNRVFASFEISKQGNELIAAINLTISIIVITASNITLANALSKEGSEFYLLKVTPIETKQIVFAKIIINILLTVFASIGIYIANIIIMKSTSIQIMSQGSLVAVCIATCLICVAHILWSIELDITHSKLQEMVNGQKENKNITVSVFIGLGFAFVVGILYFLLGRVKTYGFNIKPDVSIIILACLILLTRVILLVKKTEAYFDEITL